MSRKYVRKPSINKRVSARTTGKVNRAIKGAVNPLYGKKGMGLINDPHKAMYNKVYNKTSRGAESSVNTIVFIVFIICMIITYKLVSFIF